MNDPVLIAVTGKRDRQGRMRWTHVGRAYPHGKGDGLTLVLDVLPLRSRIYLREMNQRDWDRYLATSNHLLRETGPSACRAAAKRRVLKGARARHA